MELIPQDVKDSFAQAMLDLNGTEARPIIVFKTPQKTIISQNLSYNFVYGDSTADVSYTPVSGIINARITYLDNLSRVGAFEGKYGVNAESDLRLRLFKSPVKIMIEEKDISYFLDCQDIEFDNKMFRMISPPNLHHYYGANLYKMFLEEQQ